MGPSFTVVNRLRILRTSRSFNTRILYPTYRNVDRKGEHDFMNIYYDFTRSVRDCPSSMDLPPIQLFLMLLLGPGLVLTGLGLGNSISGVPSVVSLSRSVQQRRYVVRMCKRQGRTTSCAKSKARQIVIVL